MQSNVKDYPLRFKPVILKLKQTEIQNNDVPFFILASSLLVFFCDRNSSFDIYSFFFRLKHVVLVLKLNKTQLY